MHVHSTRCVSAYTVNALEENPPMEHRKNDHRSRFKETHHCWALIYQRCLHLTWLLTLEIMKDPIYGYKWPPNKYTKEKMQKDSINLIFILFLETASASKNIIFKCTYCSFELINFNQIKFLYCYLYTFNYSC